MVLLCDFHHDEIHHGQWTVTITDGRPVFVPPAWLDPTRSPRGPTDPKPPEGRTMSRMPTSTISNAYAVTSIVRTLSLEVVAVPSAVEVPPRSLEWRAGAGRVDAGTDPDRLPRR